MIVFSFTLLITKAKIFACKRDFVKKRYEAYKKSTDKHWWLSWLHNWWHAMWNCPMCLGVYIAAVTCLFRTYESYFCDISIVIGANWLLHCLESSLFNIGSFFEKKLDKLK